ncbi:MAG: flagellar basal body-associated FliL family protein [Cellvibrio sp.]|uniref:flagellar basal body-associated FliL family protein n=1 Tax=Cellvibrio sp. TaxID=1965322 RepID=UPI0027257E3E|nr:flagellar basal body-associated FliL family protein [Cellvibrio sp.]
MAVAPKKDADNTVADGGSKKKKLFMIIGLAVALIAISIGGTVVALKMLSPAPAPGEATAEEEQEETAVLAPAIYFEMKPNFTINFNVNGRQRYLQAAITLLYRDPQLESLLTLHMPAIRNGLVMLLSGKSFDELQTEEGKESLRAEALDIINGQLLKEQEALIAKNDDGEDVSATKVEQVLFTNFVMQ